MPDPLPNRIYREYTSYFRFQKTSLQLEGGGNLRRTTGLGRHSSLLLLLHELLAGNVERDEAAETSLVLKIVRFHVLQSTGNKTNLEVVHVTKESQAHCRSQPLLQ